MLHNIPYITPVVGAIRIGHMEENDRGKRLPKKDDHFTITWEYKQSGQWVQHPLHEAIVEAEKPHDGKLREIPVRAIYTNPELNAQERFEAYDTEIKRVVCAGNGEKARRLQTDGSFEEVDCPGEKYCEFGKTKKCGIFGRALFRLEGQKPGLGAFIMRTGSYNGVNSLRAQFTALAKLFGEKLPHIPLRLVLRASTSAQSMGSTFYYADLELGGELIDMARAAAATVAEEKELGVNRMAYEEAMVTLRNNGGFEYPTETFDDREEFVTPSFTEIAQSEGKGTEGQVGTPGGRVTVTPPVQRSARPSRKSGVPAGPLAGVAGLMQQEAHVSEEPVCVL